MKKIKNVEFTFYSTTTPEEIGLKFVLWEIVMPAIDGNSEQATGEVRHDWGFAYWDGKGWDELGVPSGWAATVKWWAETCNPDVLLKEPSRIIKLN